MTKSNKRETKEEREEVGGMGRRDKEGGSKKRKGGQEEKKKGGRGEEKERVGKICNDQGSTFVTVY